MCRYCGEEALRGTILNQKNIDFGDLAIEKGSLALEIIRDIEQGAEGLTVSARFTGPTDETISIIAPLNYCPICGRRMGSNPKIMRHSAYDMPNRGEEADET